MKITTPSSLRHSLQLEAQAKGAVREQPLDFDELKRAEQLSEDEGAVCVEQFFTGAGLPMIERLRGPGSRRWGRAIDHDGHQN